MRLSIAIMAHPLRKAMAERLSHALGDCPINCDAGQSAVENARTCWQMGLDANSDYHLVMEDDAVVPDNALLCMTTAINHFSHVHPDAPLSFFHDPRTLCCWPDAGGTEYTWVHCYHELTTGQAVCFPHKLIAPMLKFYDEAPWPHSDVRMNMFLRSIKQPVVFPWPMIVNHDFDRNLSIANRLKGL